MCTAGKPPPLAYISSSSRGENIWDSHGVGAAAAHGRQQQHAFQTTDEQTDRQTNKHTDIAITLCGADLIRQANSSQPCGQRSQ